MPATLAFSWFLNHTKFIPTLKPFHLLLPLPTVLFLFISLTVITSKRASLNFHSEVTGQSLPHHHIPIITDLLFVSPSEGYELKEGRGFSFLVHYFFLKA